MSHFRQILASLPVAFLAFSSTAFAQPTLTLSADIVTPGLATVATVTGPAGQHFAIIGSSAKAGVSHAGVALAVGPDLAILALGVLDGTGQTTINITPPFLLSALDRYYLQAAVSVSPAFTTIAVSPGRVVRNRDLVDNLPGSQGPAGPAGPVAPTAPVAPVAP